MGDYVLILWFGPTQLNFNLLVVIMIPLVLSRLIANSVLQVFRISEITQHRNQITRDSPKVAQQLVSKPYHCSARPEQQLCVSRRVNNLLFVYYIMKKAFLEIYQKPKLLMSRFLFLGSCFPWYWCQFLGILFVGIVLVIWYSCFPVII